MHDVPLQVTPAMLYVQQFNIEVPVLRVSGMGDYFPVRQFCKAIGLASQAQLEKLQADSSYAEGLEMFTVKTDGGMQPSLCIRKRELAWWLADLEPRTIRKLEVRFGIPLGEFKQSIMDAADALWWGVQASSTGRELQSKENHGALYLHCRRCQALHKLELNGDRISWEIVNEE